MKAKSGDRRPIFFIYLGRSGALGQFLLELGAATRNCGLRAGFVVSGEGELARRLASSGLTVHAMPAVRMANPLALFAAFCRAKKTLAGHIDAARPSAVITLMPHVWSPLLAREVRKRGIQYATILHDAVPHPGDPTARLTSWLLRDGKAADRIFTLSQTVTAGLLRQGVATAEKISTLFHPDLRYGNSLSCRRRDTTRPLRVLFLGRIMTYKGLGLLVDAVVELRRRKVVVELGVAGSGVIEPACLTKLEKVGAEVINRWIRDDEIDGILARYDAIACSHLEASQSGVAATAFGHQMPVIATPVPGIAGQVTNGLTGVVADHTSVASFADAIARLANDGSLYDSISHHLSSTSAGRSMDRFLSMLIESLGVPDIEEPSVGFAQSSQPIDQPSKA